MEYIFSRAGERALGELVDAHCLIALDYDGTLAPIEALPDQARTPGAMLAPLRRLHALTTVAILTGRRVSDIAERLDFTPRHTIGNHGIEGLPGFESGRAAAQEAVRSWLDQLGGASGVARLFPGLMLEEKSFSLTIHFRQSGEREAALHAIRERVARLSPAPGVIGGDCVVNLVHGTAPDKGFALRQLMALHGECRSAFYLGDDVTDERVFRDAPPNWLTVRVGSSADSAARFFVQDQSEVVVLLRKLVDVIESSGAGDPPAALANKV